jgi:hypothetical protein
LLRDKAGVCPHLYKRGQSFITIKFLFMKHLKIGMSAVVLLLAVITSFAFRPIEKKFDTLCTWFVFTGSPGEEHNPTKYREVSIDPGCPDPEVILCAICVEPSEIYGTGTPNAGLPKVDVPSTNIYQAINSALGAGNNISHFDGSGNLIWAVELQPDGQ